jgi:hypothetical protein
VSPILTRPVREQFEHDRIIRLLQARYRRKFEVAINIGVEQTASVTVGEQTVFPDLVLYSQERGRKLQGTVEVETGESVNTLEAMSQWALFSRLRVPFALYVPPSSVDTARRLCVEHNILVAELWTFHTALDQVRFTMVHRAAMPATPKSKPEPAPEDEPVTKKAVPPKATKVVTKPAVKAAAKTTGKSAGNGSTKAPAKIAPKPAAKPGAKASGKPVAKKTLKAAAKVAVKTAAARKVAHPAKRR